MNQGIARIGDRCHGVCYHPSHDSPPTVGGTIVSGSPDVTQGLSVARLGDMALTDCGHIGYIVSADETVSVNGLPVARLGDRISDVYEATIVSASTTVVS